MYEDFSTKMAHLITTYSQPVQPGENVFVLSNTEAEPLSRAMYEAILRRGGNPYIITALPGLNDVFMDIATDAQLKSPNMLQKFIIENTDRMFSIRAEVNPRSSSSHNPERTTIVQEANRPVIETYFRRSGDGSLNWIILPYPTHSMAQEAETSLLNYTQFVYEACAFHLDDPIAYWQDMSARQAKLVDYMNGKNELHVIGPDIDLTMRVDGRLWINCDGHVNFPDGEIFTGPLEDSVNGYVNFNMRTIYGGREVNGVHLHYENGVVVEASAQKGQEYLLTQLDLDEGARRMGEFAIGTNFNIQAVTGNTLFDEKIGGTIHMALGRSIPSSRGVNQSVIHWDMVHDMAHSEIYLDGALIYRNGQFTIDF